MLKNPYLTEFSLKSATNCLEKPHCGALGVPFMKSITGAALTNDDSLLCSASLSSFTSPGEISGAVAGSCKLGAYAERFFAPVALLDGAVDVPLTPLILEDFACFSIAVRTFVASLPLTVSRTCSPRLRTRKGTAVTLKLSLTSMTSSASIQIHDVVGGSVTGYEEASVSRTVVICLHYLQLVQQVLKR